MHNINKLQTLINELTSSLANNQERLTERENKLIDGFNPNDIAPNPFKDLPNVSRFGISSNVVDPLFANFGVVKKLSPKMQFEHLSRRTKAANRYMKIMYYRLTKLLYLNRSTEFWILALMLMDRSNVLKALALRKVLPNWHRNLKFGTVKILLNSLNNMLKEMPTNLKIKRQYEPKHLPDGGTTWRPVGNPAYVDRMFLYIWQCFLVIYLNRYIDQSQHAYRPGKGVPTALAEVQESLEKFPYVWEFDLKGAFPSLVIPKTCDALASVGVPESISDYIMMMSIHTIEEVNLKEARDRGLNSRLGRPLDESKYIRQNNIRSGPLPIFAALGLEMELAACKSRPTHFIPIEFKGFPQGSGISPIMFIFAFEHFARRAFFETLHPSVKVIAYADDFLVFSKVPLPNIFDLPDTGGGLIINHDKSRQLRDDNRWLHPKFKFLGTTFHLGERIVIEGTPRSGASLVFNKEAAVGREIFRTNQLRKLINYFKDSPVHFPSSPQQLIADWGLGKWPSNLLPLEVIQGKAAVDKPLLSSLGSVLSTPNKSRSDVVTGNSVTSASLAERMKKAPNWLQTHLKGFWLSRLHAGSWNTDAASPNRSIMSHPKAQGRAWVDLSAATAVNYLYPKTAAWLHHALSKDLSDNLRTYFKSMLKNISIHTSTSYATKDLLEHLRTPMKISKKGLRYSAMKSR